MSDDRRAFNARQRLVNPSSSPSPPASPAVPEPVDTSSPAPFTDYTDPDYRRAAYDQVREMAKRDPEAAAFLLEQIEAAVAAPPSPVMTTTPDISPISPGALDSRDPFDPMKLYSSLAAYYHFSDPDMRLMPLKRLLAYFREMVLRQEAEARAMRAASDQSSASTSDMDPDLANALAEAELAGSVSRPVIWPSESSAPDVFSPPPAP